MPECNGCGKKYAKAGAWYDRHVAQCLEASTVVRIPIKDPSEEQQTIIDDVSNGCSVIINAVPGSGKTTTILQIAKALPDKKVTLVTYNRNLSDETKEKKRGAQLTNLSVYTYHGLATCFYATSVSIHDDKGMDRVIRDNEFPKKRDSIDVLAFDEAQDMTPLFYAFCKKFISEVPFKSPQLIIVGDGDQAVNEFRKADRRF